MNNRSVRLNRPAFLAAEHEGEEDLAKLLCEALEFYINQKAGRVLVKEKNGNEPSLLAEDVDFL